MGFRVSRVIGISVWLLLASIMLVSTCEYFVLIVRVTDVNLGYDIESWNGNYRYQFDAQISSQDLVEYYLPSFQSCARDSNVGAFMCSYS
jgi:hypothetical protein